MTPPPGCSPPMQTEAACTLSTATQAGKLAEAVEFIESQVIDAGEGLPEEIFLFASRLTPLVNVDLLIRDADSGVLLTWREDPIFGRGWHVPGGCVRLGERFADRIDAVAAGELGARVAFEPQPLGVFETVDKRRHSRTHHVTLLYACTLLEEPDPRRRQLATPATDGSWAWHRVCPDDFLQEPYRLLIGDGSVSLHTGLTSTDNPLHPR